AAGQETPGIVVQMRRGGFLTGTITGYEGGPLAGAEVRTMVQPPNASGNPWQWEWQLRQTAPALTDKEGRFRVEGLTPGPYIVRFEAPGHRVVTKLDVAVPEGADGGPLDVKLEKGLQITGVVVDAAGEPIPDVNLWTNVVATGTGAARGQTSIRNATTDAKGAFLLDQLEPGKYSLSVNADGFANRNLSDVDAGTTDLRIVLEKGLSISGRVLLPDGSPAGNLWVSAQGGNGNSQNDRTGEDGTFTIENLPEGVYTVRTNTGGAFRFGGGKDEGPSLMPAIQEGVPAGTKNLELRLLAGAAIEGRVTDESGNPIPGAMILARSIGEDVTTSGFGRTDENGEFRVTGLEPGRRVAVNVSHGDYGPLPGQEVDSDSTGLSFVLPPKPEQPDVPEVPELPTPR
ncbi:MAG: carboxypeptidase-like regulatory domain-containing protein, partial [Planctomycetota bacterium]